MRILSIDRAKQKAKGPSHGGSPARGRNRIRAGSSTPDGSRLSPTPSLASGIFGAACAGACLGFLWFNCYPASIFMGDTGSLALGAGFACMAVVTNSEIVSLIIGGLFIIETLSVMIQVVSFKLTGKRVFLMAPIHHHFEKLGWAETKVVIRFWIVSAAFGALGLALFFQLG